MKMLNSRETLFWILLTATIIAKSDGDSPCRSYCRTQNYKPSSVYKSAQVNDVSACFEECNKTSCKMIGFTSSTGQCLLSDTEELAASSHRYNLGTTLYWIMPGTNRCRFQTPPLLVPQVEYNFETLGTATPEGSVTLPSSDGYIGSGACVNAIGPNNCITLATNPTGCPFEPQKCSEGLTWSFWFYLKTTATQDAFITAVERPGIEIKYMPAKRIFVNLWLDNSVWHEQCYASNIPEEDLFFWTHLTVVWKNIIGTQDPEKSEGVRMFVNGTHVPCWSKYKTLSSTYTDTTSFRLGCANNKQSNVEACYDEIQIFTYPLDDASVAQLSGI